MFLLIARIDAELGRLYPDLQEMRLPLGAVVELTVHHAAAGTHALHIARQDGGAIAHVVTVGQGAGDHITDDLHVAVAMGAETGTGLHAIFIDHAQRAVTDMVRVVIIGE